MNLEKFLKDNMSVCNNFKDNWNTDCTLLNALVQIYKKTNDQSYKDIVLKYGNKVVQADGTISNFHCEDKKEYIKGATVLVFLYEQTADEKYKKAMDNAMGWILNCPKTMEDILTLNQDATGQVILSKEADIIPFYMEYETKFDKKEKYNDIIHQLKSIRDTMFDEETMLYAPKFDETRQSEWSDKETGLDCKYNAYDSACYLMALVDTIDACSEEIYEVYRLIKDMFKESLKGILRYMSGENYLFPSDINRVTNAKIYDYKASLMIAYSIMKGCKNGTLLVEKYEFIGCMIRENVLEAIDVESMRSDSAFMSILIMAYAI